MLGCVQPGEGNEACPGAAVGAVRELPQESGCEQAQCQALGVSACTGLCGRWCQGWEEAPARRQECLPSMRVALGSVPSPASADASSESTLERVAGALRGTWPSWGSLGRQGPCRTGRHGLFAQGRMNSGRRRQWTHTSWQIVMLEPEHLSREMGSERWEQAE